MSQASKDTASEGGKWLSVAQLAGELGMSEMTLYRLIERGELPAVRLGRRLVIPARVLDDLVAAAFQNAGGAVQAAEEAGGAA